MFFQSGKQEFTCIYFGSEKNRTCCSIEPSNWNVLGGSRKEEISGLKYSQSVVICNNSKHTRCKLVAIMEASG